MKNCYKRNKQCLTLEDNSSRPVVSWSLALYLHASIYFWLLLSVACGILLPLVYYFISRDEWLFFPLNHLSHKVTALNSCVKISVQQLEQKLYRKKGITSEILQTYFQASIQQLIMVVLTLDNLYNLSLSIKLKLCQSRGVLKNY